MTGEPASGMRHSVRIDSKLLNHSGISGGELRLYALILKWDRGNGCFAGEDRLARDLGKSVRTVQRYLRNLKSLGLVKIQQRGRGSTAVLRCL
ncbi:MAG: hypothetical protein A3F84_11995 [Candidatus Handelsmanbacteria bacterium RIFCSPLOWO2_12_FULL_64_10]|uniref:Helix-turn-helix type 11 domain-containing protein n=1 Tax=Handelsmanbacteria sp. (strain RIFCSPLOWO2_12_FULL_64_10) TaxID=1817868 RepID=A0A1F6CMF8_HANXR|nr:MAG: hypothetical protein A3F84_11995 [Candidatus Handelsmanbacteria bacterium RIFCSPLOWO2_12_FULL_64_10]